MYQQIVVALDGSQCGRLALDEAVRLATHFDASILAVYVVEHINQIEDIVPDRRNQPPLDEDAVREGEKALAHAAQLFREYGIDGLTRKIDIYDTSVPDAIAEAARGHRADLVVMGTHGRQGFMHFLLGSVAEAYLRIAETPVLLVRHSS